MQVNDKGHYLTLEQARVRSHLLRQLHNLYGMAELLQEPHAIKVTRDYVDDAVRRLGGVTPTEQKAWWHAEFEKPVQQNDTSGERFEAHRRVVYEVWAAQIGPEELDKLLKTCPWYRG